MSFLSQNLPNQVRGDSWYLRFNILDSYGQPIDITNNEYWITLKKLKDDTDANAALQIGPIIATGLDAAAGVVTLYASPNDTDIAIDTYYYDLQEVTPTGINTLVIGKVKVVKDITLTADYSGNPAVVPTPIAIAVGELTKDMNGFVDRDEFTYAFDDSTRTYSLTPVGDFGYIYYRGEQFAISSTLSLVISNTEGGRYIVFDPDTEELAEGTVNGPPSILNDCLVAYIYWDGSRAIIFGDERHGVERDTTWHQAQHLNVGAVWRTGGDITYTLLDENSISLGIENITFADEDLIHVIEHNNSPTLPYDQILSPAASLPVLYLDGTHYTESTPNTVPWLVGANTAYYNQISSGSGSLVEMSNGHYVTYWVLATNDSRNPIKLLLGSVDHSTQKSAEAETFQNYGLSFPEIVPMYKIVLETKIGYTNKVVLVSVSQIISRLSSAYTLSEISSGTFATITAPPATSTSGGTPGQIAYDSTYLYICIATNSWKRITLESW